jgi:hypothetical protein
MLIGCAAKQKITHFNDIVPQKICIAKHEAVKDSFLTALQEGFSNHNIDTRVVRGVYEKKGNMYYPQIDTSELIGCDAITFYAANWSWDLAMYMSYANIWVTDIGMTQKIAQAHYQTRGGPDKFINARNKVLELVDQMYDGAGR